MIMTQGSHNRIYIFTRDTHDYIILHSLFPTIDLGNCKWLRKFGILCFCKTGILGPQYIQRIHTFITSIAFKCVELNAHALMIALIAAKDNFVFCFGFQASKHFGPFRVFSKFWYVGLYKS